jgi:hypothetical protein
VNKEIWSHCKKKFPPTTHPNCKLIFFKIASGVLPFIKNKIQARGYKSTKQDRPGRKKGTKTKRTTQAKASTAAGSNFRWADLSQDP